MQEDAQQQAFMLSAPNQPWRSSTKWLGGWRRLSIRDSVSQRCDARYARRRFSRGAGLANLTCCSSKASGSNGSGSRTGFITTMSRLRLPLDF